VTRYSPIRGRNLTRSEAFTERFAMSGAGYRYLLWLAPRIDRLVIPRTKGRWSSVGKDRAGLVTMTGAKSGEERTQPLSCIEDTDGTLLLIGSNYGRPHHPAWTANLRANPECSVTYGGETANYTARELEGEERATAWERAVDWYGGYALYEEKCRPRVIRIFRLART
jgi:deazaflavin-dependent oxidoreductase (nitroreductase family)